VQNVRRRVLKVRRVRIACAEIAKADIFFVSTDRAESEVVLDPYSIKRLHLEIAS
jgi:hypothetical protein